MSLAARIATPAAIAAAPVAAQPLLAAVGHERGLVPNELRVVAQSPAALQGYLGLSRALDHGALDDKTRARIALAVAEANRCDYSVSAHSYLGTYVAKLDDADLAACRDGRSTDAKADAAVRFAVAVVAARGHVSDAEVRAVKAAGYGDAQVIEIVVHVALNTLSNYVNEVAQTEIDFPIVAHRAK